MAAKDLFQDAVKQALFKEQWVITADPMTINPHSAPSTVTRVAVAEKVVN